MMTAAQMRAARALLGMEQRALAELSGVSLPTIQRMEASDGNVRGNVESLTKVVEALRAAGVELIGDNGTSDRGGRGVRLRQPANRRLANVIRNTPRQHLISIKEAIQQSRQVAQGNSECAVSEGD